MKKVLFLMVFLVSASMSIASYAGIDRNISKEEKEEYYSKILGNALAGAFDHLELAEKNHRFSKLRAKYANHSITLQEKEEAEDLQDNYSCQKYSKAFEGLLRAKGKELVLITFIDDECKKCSMANAILATMSQKHGFQLDIIKPVALKDYSVSNSLEGDSLASLILDFKDDKLRHKMLQKDRVPVLAYDKNYGIILPVATYIRKVKNNCTGLLTSVALLKMTQ